MNTTNARRLAKARRAAQQQRLDEAYAEAERIVATGCCPDCGGKLKRSLALTGWWHCEQRGAVGFREHNDKPACDFQCFTRN